MQGALEHIEYWLLKVIVSSERGEVGKMRKSTWFVCATLFSAVASTQVFAADPGKAIYEAHCSSCHGENGKGLLPGIPDFTKKGGVLSESDALLVQRITDGYQSPGSPMAMPPKGGDSALTEQEIKDVVSYLQRAFGA